jgi:hypothetical protein
MQRWSFLVSAKGFLSYKENNHRFCGLMARVLGYRPGGPGFRTTRISEK